MSAVAEKSLLSPEDLLSLPDEKNFELIEGELLERNMGVLSSWVAIQLLKVLGEYGDKEPLGWFLGSDAGYQCFPHSPRTVRKPDVSFVRKGRFPDEQIPEGWARLAPDLAVEVVSPNDVMYELDDKVTEYRKVGVPLIWIVNPRARTVHVYRPNGPIIVLSEGDELSGEDVLPGFVCPVAAIFPPRPAPADAPAQ